MAVARAASLPRAPHTDLEGLCHPLAQPLIFAGDSPEGEGLIPSGPHKEWRIEQGWQVPALCLERFQWALDPTYSL